MENTKVCFHASGKEAKEREKLTMHSNEHVIPGVAGREGGQSAVQGLL